MLNIFIHGVAYVGGAFALWSLYKSVKEIRDVLLWFNNEIEHLQKHVDCSVTYKNGPLDNSNQLSCLVTCGGCGQTVATVDGFTPLAHSCNGEIIHNNRLTP